MCRGCPRIRSLAAWPWPSALLPPEHRTRALYTAAEIRCLTYAARARLATFRRLRRMALRNELRRLPEIGYAFPDSGWPHGEEPAEAVSAFTRVFNALRRRRASRTMVTNALPVSSNKAASDCRRAAP